MRRNAKTVDNSKPCTCDANEDSVQSCERHGKVGHTKAARAKKQAQQGPVSPYSMQRVRRAWVDVLGVIWMPAATAAMRYDLTDYDLENIGPFTREKVEQWLCTHSGDFQSVTDFAAVCGDAVIEWSSEENELAFVDCMYPAED